MSGFFIPSAIADNIGWSLGVAAFCFALRLVGEALARRSGDPLIMRKRRFTVRALTNALLALALLGIWLSEIQNVLFSLTAVLVALVVATKELILCVSGSVLRFGGHLFKVGDRIELYGIRGEGKSATHRAAAYMEQKRFEATKIHTHTFPLEETPTALKYARERIEDAIKVVVKMNH